MSVTTFGRKVTRFEHDNAIKQNPRTMDNSWNALCIEVAERDQKPHFLRIRANRPKSEKQTDFMPNVVALTILLNKLRESHVTYPEIAFFPLGTRDTHKDPAILPILNVLHGEPKIEIEFNDFQKIDQLFFDKNFTIVNNSISARMKEILDKRDESRNLIGQKEVFYRMDVSLEGLDLGIAKSLARV